MPTYEYCTISSTTSDSENATKQMNSLAKDGWVLDKVTSTNYQVIYVMRRKRNYD